MTLTNHLLTGAVLAKVLPLPIAIPLAFASHFILDAVPHFGFASIEERMKYKKVFSFVVLLDFIVGLAFSVWLINQGHFKWFIVGLIAYSPDLAWVYRFTIVEKFGTLKPTEGNRFVQFHGNIQKYEHMWGGIVELLYAAGALLIIH